MEIKPNESASPNLIQLADLFNIAEWQDQISWKPFRNGVEIHYLYGDGLQGPSAALIRYRKGASVPLHEHIGYEHIIVLSGSQVDHHRTPGSSTLRLIPPPPQQ